MVSIQATTHRHPGDSPSLPLLVEDIYTYLKKSKNSVDGYHYLVPLYKQKPYSR